jgi:hypothetical protein
MKTILLILFSILPVSAFAQDLGPRPIAPVRVVVSAPQGELADDAREELRRSGDVVIVERKPDFEIRLNGRRIDSSGCHGYAVAALVIRRSDNLHDLNIYIGSDIQELAKFIVETINKEHLARWREDVSKRK